MYIIFLSILLKNKIFDLLLENNSLLIRKKFRIIMGENIYGKKYD